MAKQWHAILMLTAAAAVNFELFEGVAPLLVIDVNGRFVGGLGNFFYAKHVN